MHLSELKIASFRSCKETTVHLQKDLTVLVGENNAGKSNILDAIRLLTTPLNGRRERYAEDVDVRRGTDPSTFEMTAHYRGLSDALKGLLITAVPDPTEDHAIFGCRYSSKTNDSARGRFSSWAGKFDTAEPESGSTDLIRHVYLPALRDAHQALGSGGATRVMALFRHFLPKTEEAAFLAEIQRPATTPGVLTRMNTDIGNALKELTNAVRPQSAEINFGENSVQDIARDLRFKLGDSGISMEDIRTSGLGYSNLLYMATVVVELTKAKDADLTLFLVEEPEAHLHPQLQMLVLEFLLSKAKESSLHIPTPGHPEGRIQVIVSTHSPNLTAWVSPKHLVVVRTEKDDTDAPCTKCVPICKLDLSEAVLNKVSRYLDVTRAALLFGKSTALVEGIAEALLLPTFARKLVLHEDHEAWLRFRSTIIIPIDGVDFRPYVEILLRPNENVRVADRVVVITDGDPSVAGNRKEDLETFATEVGAADNLFVFTNEVTLEHELFKAGNEAFLKAVYLKICPRSTANWTTRIEGVAVAARPQAFVDLLAFSKVRKGDLAQEIAASIEVGETFIVPAYLRNAIIKMAE